MMESVFKDNLGNRVIQADLHQEIQWHIDECKRRGEQYCGVLAPWGHGKTENAVIGRVLDEIGKNQNIRIFIISNTDENAKARIESITNYIKNDPDYKEVYPRVRAADEGSWTKHKIIVERESRVKDGTVESYGVLGSGVGGRCDMLVFDDPVDMRNSISNPALRPQVKSNIENVWLSRLTPEGFALYVATVWHQDDATSWMMKNKKWKFLVMKVSDDFNWIECESPFKGKYCIPLWDYWNKAKLLSRLEVIGLRAFNRGFRQQALSDEDRSFPSSESIFRKDTGLNIVQPQWPRVVGVDPFGKRVVIFVIAVNPSNHMRYPIEIRHGAWSPATTIDEIISVWHRHSPQVIVCENNASQEAIVQWSMERGHRDLPILPFTTGKQKADPALGLPSLEVEFANGAWCVPCAHVDEFDQTNGINLWRKELLEHPLGQAEDTIMASWFAREGARFLMGYQSNDKILGQEETIGVERVNIGESL